MPPIKISKPSEQAPTINLTASIEGGDSMSPDSFARHLKAPEIGPSVLLVGESAGVSSRAANALREPEVRLALASGQAEREHNDFLCDPEQLPALLVSYVYYEKFKQNRHRYHYRNWMMDSGAYSAYNSGKSIDIDKYIEHCHQVLESDPKLTEIIALDVIDSGTGSLKNAEYMRNKGVDVIPVFHYGEDWGILKEYCAGWNKVGLSCRFGEPLTKSYKFYDQCFARGWPKKFHSFGWISEEMLMRYPFHSGDSTSWETRPCKFGSWMFFGKVSIRGSEQNLRSQVLWYLELEERLRRKWKKEMLQLSKFPIVGSS